MYTTYFVYIHWTYTYVIVLYACLLATRQLIEIHNRKVPISEFNSGKRQCFVFSLCSIVLPIDDCHLLPRLCDTHIISVGKTKQGRDIIAEGGSFHVISWVNCFPSPTRVLVAISVRAVIYPFQRRAATIFQNVILDTFGKNLFVIV